MGRSLSLHHQAWPDACSASGSGICRHEQGAGLRQPGLAHHHRAVEWPAWTNPFLIFRGDSDAYIVRGLIAILLALYSGEIARDILTADPSALFERLGLREYLTPQRSNGLKSMVARIRAEAQTVLTPPIDPVVSALDRCRRFRVIQGGVR